MAGHPVHEASEIDGSATISHRGITSDSHADKTAMLMEISIPPPTPYDGDEGENTGPPRMAHQAAAGRPPLASCWISAVWNRWPRIVLLSRALLERGRPLEWLISLGKIDAGMRALPTWQKIRRTIRKTWREWSSCLKRTGCSVGRWRLAYVQPTTDNLRDF